jgi:hypothetical protein
VNAKLGQFRELDPGHVSNQIGQQRKKYRKNSVCEIHEINFNFLLFHFSRNKKSTFVSTLVSMTFNKNVIFIVFSDYLGASLFLLTKKYRCMERMCSMYSTVRSALFTSLPWFLVMVLKQCGLSIFVQCTVKAKRINLNCFTSFFCF